MSRTLLVDGNALMHRSYHAVKFNPTFEGRPVGMVYGFTSGLLYAIENFAPEFCAVAFDTKEKTFRHEMDENYKAQRQKAPDDFYPQLPFIDEALEALNVPILRNPGYEADDIVGTLAIQAAEHGQQAVIMSHDMDYTQLLNDQIILCRSAGKISDENLFGPKETEEKLGIPPSQVVDYKAIVGDSSDNFKGVEGIGPKGAVDLLKEFGDLDTILQSLNKLPDKYRTKIEGNEDYVRHCQILAKIDTNVAVDFEFSETHKFTPNFETLARLCERFGFNALQNRAQKMSSKKYSELNIEQENNSKKEESEEQMSLF